MSNDHISAQQQAQIAQAQANAYMNWLAPPVPPSPSLLWNAQDRAVLAVNGMIDALGKSPSATGLALIMSAIVDTDYPVARRQEAFENIIKALRRPATGEPRAGPLDTTDPKELTMATTAILTPPGVASFLNLDKARVMPGVANAEPRFSVTLIFDKAAQKLPEFRELQKGCDEAVKEFFRGKIPPGLRSPFHDGAEKEGQYEGYKAGDLFISPWSKNKPGCVNRQRQEILDWTEFYAGWTARAYVRPFGYDQAGNKGCGLFLDVVQFLKPGKRLDGRKNATEAFPDDQTEDEEV